MEDLRISELCMFVEREGDKWDSNGRSGVGFGV